MLFKRSICSIKDTCRCPDRKCQNGGKVGKIHEDGSESCECPEKYTGDCCDIS